MPYSDRFLPTDYLIADLLPYLATINDAAILASYAGFLSVSSVTVYELAIRDIFSEFAIKKNKVFGHFIDNHLSKINGRIKLDDLKKNQIKAFGVKYLQKFEAHLNIKETDFFHANRKSIKACYSNLITCRHEFVHQGNSTLTHLEVIENYNIGKEIIHSLFFSMQR